MQNQATISGDLRALFGFKEMMKNNGGFTTKATSKSTASDSKSGSKSGSKSSKFKTESIAILWTLAFIVFLRIYILEPYVIPSGSMEPTLLIGDHVFVARGAYDFKIPFTNVSLVTVSNPKRGDVIVFDYPIEDSDDAGKFFVKRVIGLPGDKIEIRRGQVHVNGQALAETSVSVEEAAKRISGFTLLPENELFREQIPNAREDSHWVHRDSHKTRHIDAEVELFRTAENRDCVNRGESDNPTLFFNQICPFTVAENSYFAMGDNRDNSSDSRVFGFIPRHLIKGRVLFIWFSPPPGEVNPYTSGTGPDVLAALKDMIPGFFRMIKDPSRRARVGDVIR